MSSVVDISLANLLGFVSLLLLPLLLLQRWQLIDVSKDMVISIGRMVAQLLLVGLYLKYLFELNHTVVNIVWLLIMMTVANTNIVRRAGLRSMKLLVITQISLLLSITVVTGLFLVVLVQPDSLFDARYLIPIAGMLLGNCLQGNIRALEVFFGELKDQEEAYLSDLLLGATVREAVEPALKKAFRSSLTPILGSMATLGIVFLPGMMTGQILGGALPFIAAKYQIGIMVGIFMAVFCAIALNLQLCLRVAFNPFGVLDKSVLLQQSE
ncbi:ABC transporter permease [Sansalvadorimonas verongulae]|uniref:ABC transporter permease n=1 Tax=Sansalvadorimonas verongulae TaxID=2172824 RepID=UPI0012BC2350|nr:ABC transporter permease [Sansalvadorimonas verongulae]MTI12647.1 ABC transporter permease [Sansalvadorimonas verongulae]